MLQYLFPPPNTELVVDTESSALSFTEESRTEQEEENKKKKREKSYGLLCITKAQIPVPPSTLHHLACSLIAADNHSRG